MSPGVITLILFGSMIVLLALGTPVAFALGGIAVFVTFFLWDPAALSAVPLRIIGSLNVFVLAALPLFVFMGVFLERSGIADDLFEMFNQWIGALRGGLAVGTVGVCTIFAGMVGTSSASTLTVGTVALPAMRKRNYDKAIILGSIQAGGALGFLIPPSVMFIVYGVFAEESVGRLFAGGVFPGLVLSFLFSLYILVRSFFQPQLAPSLGPEERGSWKVKFATLRSVILPLWLVGMVLGSMFTGIATPSEAAAGGAFGAIICSAIYRKLTWANFKEACYRTIIFTGMAMWIMIGAKCFVGVYMALGAAEFMEGLFLSIPFFGRWGVLIMMQLTLFILGMILDPFGIIMVCTPVFIPIIKTLGFDPVWFGVLFILNMEMAFLTPPFGFNLFYMKGLTSIIAKDVTMADIYRSVAPFVVLQMIGLIIVMIFPQIALWFPNLIFGS